jgi:hypothetical protein
MVISGAFHECGAGPLVEADAALAQFTLGMVFRVLRPVYFEDDAHDARSPAVGQIVPQVVKNPAPNPGIPRRRIDRQVLQEASGKIREMRNERESEKVLAVYGEIAVLLSAAQFR